MTDTAIKKIKERFTVINYDLGLDNVLAVNLINDGNVIVCKIDNVYNFVINSEVLVQKRTYSSEELISLALLTSDTSKVINQIIRAK